MIIMVESATNKKWKRQSRWKHQWIWSRRSFGYLQSAHISLLDNTVWLRLWHPLFFCPQFKRKSTEGVSFFLFALVILGNTTYGLSVLLKNPDDGQGEKSYIIHHLPWLIGSLGTLSLDLFVSFAKQSRGCAAAGLHLYHMHATF